MHAITHIVDLAENEFCIMRTVRHIIWESHQLSPWIFAYVRIITQGD